MPVTECPKLRRVRELIAQEVVQLADYRQQRQDAAIDEWRCAPLDRGIMNSSASGPICGVLDAITGRSNRLSTRKLRLHARTDVEAHAT
jgi:hypothetical protein